MDLTEEEEEVVVPVLVVLVLVEEYDDGIEYTYQYLPYTHLSFEEFDLTWVFDPQEYSV